jgi:C_GCAxxG_C_C family probable redox protein
MSLADFKDMEFSQANRRMFLKILALTGTLSLIDFLGPFKQMGFGKEGGMTPDEMREKAIQVFMKQNPFMCSQATFAVGQEKLGKVDWEIVRAMGAFGGGLGGNGETCGALIGALAVIGLKYGRERAEEKENPKMWACNSELVTRFREEIVKNHSGIRCRDISGVDWKIREQAVNYYKGEKVKECARIVGDTAKLTGEILERQA